ncbi:MAG TPA: peptidase domain-containing ABC transporter [Blastocatellia bacterium]|nr:peptidase domain-containing ABC transporter [Blastocatellia bacterium]
MTELHAAIDLKTDEPPSSWTGIDRIRAAIHGLDERTFRFGEVLFSEGEAVNGWYLLTAGEGRILARPGGREPETVKIIEAGQWIPAAPTITERIAKWSCRAMTETRVLFISADQLLTLQDRSPELLRAGLEEALKIAKRLESGTGLTHPRPSQLDRPPDCPAPETLGSERIEQSIRHRFSSRFPVIRQMDSNDCGAACLTSILRYYGAQAELLAVRQQLRMGKPGVRLYDLVQAAEKRGFSARTIRAQSMESLSPSRLPAICHWKKGHFVVVYQVNRRVVVMDPALGIRKLRPEEFLAQWTGNTLLLEPTGDFTDDPPPPTITGYFLPAIKKEKKVFVDAAVASVILQLLLLLSPLLMQMLLDRVLILRSASLMTVILAGLLGMALFEISIRSIREYLLTYAAQRIEVRLSSQLYRHLINLSLSIFESRPIGDLVRRFEDSRLIRELFSSRILSAMIDAVTAVACITLIFHYSYLIGFSLIGFVCCYLLLIGLLTPHLWKRYQLLFKRESDQQSFLIESIAGVQTIKNLRLEIESQWRYEDLGLSSARHRLNAAKLSIAGGGIGQLLVRGSSMLILWLSATAVLREELSIGAMIAINALAAGTMSPALSLLNFLRDWQESRVAAQRIADIYAIPTEHRQRPGGIRSTNFRGEIVFENVSFRYQNRPERNVLSNVSFRIEPGETIGIVGRSGCGKSTLAKLLAGHYPLSEGRILLDGIDLRQFDLEDLRLQIGLVSQEPFLYNRTIRENIAITNPQASMDEVIQAARLALCHEFVMELPAGYHTVIGERGQTLSGGQRQRLCLARQFLRPSPLVIFDEATSALDSETEERIMTSVLNHSRNRTALIVAHRFSTIKQADRILVFEQGVLVEQGSHQELLDAHGLYAYLWQKQLP